ncbi:hypothetical protein CHS0354_032415 [Potamilus streckersoni]|uniref:Uncharacterized protein n=1 Tax=Potamilus streckersoni TaxID=2493646 RepID=A0AAE0S2B1_9BIVA|nr:hypothetical protein CHS0354_032415 [Potamilus streckersoni]
MDPLLAFNTSEQQQQHWRLWLKDVTTTSQTAKRSLSEIDLPNELTFHLKRGSKDVTLNLRRNHVINPNADFYFARKLKNGQSALVKSRNLEKKKTLLLVLVEKIPNK